VFKAGLRLMSAVERFWEEEVGEVVGIIYSR